MLVVPSGEDDDYIEIPKWNIKHVCHDWFSSGDEAVLIYLFHERKGESRQHEQNIYSASAIG
jgi:hypothetical protein